MMSDSRLDCERFRRASKYNPEWVMAGVSGGANPLWMTEWLTEKMDLQPGMRVLDLGCGRGMSSVFLHREFGVQVWAADLWFDPTERFQRIQDAGAEQGVFPIHVEARSLPFAAEYFDAVISIDSYIYYGTDDLFLNYLSRFIKPGGQIGMAGAGLVREIQTEIPAVLRDWWSHDMACFHTADWWRQHWERSGIVEVETADTLPDGWQYWVKWHKLIAPENHVEIAALEADRGEHLGYTRLVARRKPSVAISEQITSIPTEYSKRSLFAE